MALDWPTFLVSVLGSGGAAFAAVKWVGQKWIDHRLEVAVEERKAELAQAANRAKAEIENQLRLSTESLLGEEAAERSYRYEARKRLYTAVGPLRFQLVQASIQFRSRVRSFEREVYVTSISRYFGRSLLFRIGQVLALAELIERQIAHADFSVDPATVLLLRFRREALRALSSGMVSLGHPNEDWSQQKEHVFRDQLPILAVSMVVAEDNRPDRVVRFDEFIYHLEQGKGAYMQPLAGLVDQFDVTKTPILWLRLLALAEACGGLLDQDSAAEALDPPALDLRALLGLSRDEFLLDHHEKYLAMLAEFRNRVALPSA